MTGILIGYARCSTDAQDLTAQRAQLVRLGVDETRIYVEDGLTGANRDRPGLRQAVAAVRAGDTLVAAKLDRLARSVMDARTIADELTAGGVALSIGGTVQDPNDAVGRLLFNALAMVAEFERDLIAQRTRQDMAIARARGRLRGKQPKLSGTQERHRVALVHGGGRTIAEIAQLFGVGRSTVCRGIQRALKSTQPAGASVG